ncbi:MAG TPA: hypothetical protein VFN67_05075 [Polyangiales bacterium]|nr:hypothetical protein [Polyangiales bacterium]
MSESSAPVAEAAAGTRAQQASPPSGAENMAGQAGAAGGGSAREPKALVEQAARGAAGAVATTAGTAGASAPAATSDGSLFPLKIGNAWTFRTTKGAEVGTKIQTVGALEMVGGRGPMSAAMAYRMVTTKDDGMDKTESWQAELEGRIVRYREKSYAAANGELEIEEHWEPYKLRVDGTQLTPGATYTEEYKETKLVAGAVPATATSTDTWRVVAVEEMVTVPAGTFSAVVIEKVGGTSTKRYWFARGVGKVKEQSGTQVEELTEYKLMP